MDWVITTLLLLVIFLALLLLVVKHNTYVKIIVFLIILCNVGIIILGNRMENFVDYTDILDKIKNFKDQSYTISTALQESSSGMNETNQRELISKVDTLNNNIKNLEELLNTSIGMDSLNIGRQKVNFQTSDKVLNDIELYKQLQLAKLTELQNQLNKTQQIVNAQQNASDKNKYKPIKIYSSCIVGNADGTYST